MDSDLPWTSREAARERARKLANNTRHAVGVYEHVGSYGREGGDVAATHEFMARSFAGSDPPEWWALVECIDPEGV